jgi:hypothetical protein
MTVFYMLPTTPMRSRIWNLGTQYLLHIWVETFSERQATSSVVVHVWDNWGYSLA